MRMDLSSAITLHTIRPSNLEPRAPGPLCVFVHGLDSYSGTWKSTMEKLSVPCLAVDQRGCGKSEMGPEDEFSQNALVNDLHKCIKANTDEPIILVGHSLGGRIVLGYAARYPENLAAVIIEDMDIKPRPTSSSPVPITTEDRPLFDRRAASKRELTESLEEAGYKLDRIDQWWDEGRLTKEDDHFWSHVNPDFRRLCYQHVLSTENGHTDCQTIVSRSPKLPCYLLVAGKKGTVCEESSIEKMKCILSTQLEVHYYPVAGHSIHNTESSEFLQTIEEIIESTK